MTKPTVRSVWIFVYPSLDSPKAAEGTCDQQRLSSNCTDADLSLCWLHKSCRFCHMQAHI